MYVLLYGLQKQHLVTTFTVMWCPGRGGLGPDCWHAIWEPRVRFPAWFSNLWKLGRFVHQSRHWKFVVEALRSNPPRWSVDGNYWVTTFLRILSESLDDVDFELLDAKQYLVFLVNPLLKIKKHFSLFEDWLLRNTQEKFKQNKDFKNEKAVW